MHLILDLKCQHNKITQYYYYFCIEPMKAATTSTTGISTSSSRTTTNFSTESTTLIRETTISSTQYSAGSKASSSAEALASRTIEESGLMTSPVQGALLGEVESENPSLLGMKKETPNSFLSSYHSISESTTWTTFVQRGTRASIVPSVHSSEELENITTTHLGIKEETPNSLTNTSVTQTTSSEIRTASAISDAHLSEVFETATATQLSTREETPTSPLSQHSTSESTTHTTFAERRTYSSVPGSHSREVFKTIATQQSTRKERPSSPLSNQHPTSKSTPQDIFSERKTMASVVPNLLSLSRNPSTDVEFFTSSPVLRPSTKSTRVGGHMPSQTSSSPKSSNVRTGESWSIHSLNHGVFIL